MAVLGGLIYLNTYFSELSQTHKQKQGSDLKKVNNEWKYHGEISKAGQDLPEVQIFLRQSFVYAENCDPELRIETLKYVVSNGGNTQLF